MLTVIFGAGASYDSHPSKSSLIHNDEIKRFRPPTAKDLFDEARFGDVCRKYPQLHPILSELRESVPNIEKELEKMKENAEYYPRLSRSLLALRFYLRDIIHNTTELWKVSYIDVSAYARLLRILDEWRHIRNEEVSIITFNYDTLLEQACESVLGLKLNKLDSYIENNSHFKIFKVHGSTDWSRMVTGTKEDIYENSDKLIWTNKYFTSNHLPVLPADTQYVPALAIPTITKSSFEFPQTHNDEMIKVLDQTSDLITIGWRGAEEHFMKLLKNPNNPISNRRLQVVATSREKASLVESNIISGSKVNYGFVKSFDSGFSEYLKGDIKDFIGAPR